MTLGFSTKWPKSMGELAGQPNYFTNKIMKSMWEHYPKLTNEFIGSRTEEENIRFDEIEPFEPLSIYELSKLAPKLHTIRHDPHNRWKKGMKIHMVIYNRTKNRFQFAPVLECTGTQEIEIKWNCLNEGFYCPIGSMNRVKHFAKSGGTVSVKIDGRYINEAGLMELAIYDGFPSINAFFQYFHEDTKPNTKIIHWTDIRY